MDYKILFILMLALYLLPELLKRKRPAKYKYPEVPARQPAETGGPSSDQHFPEFITNITTDSYEANMQPEIRSSTSDAPGATLVTPQYPWLGIINTNTVVKGMIFAEIIQPPRAMRPLKTVRRGAGR